MYYPLQIPYLLNKTFQQHIEYREYHHPDLKNCMMCLWTMQSKEELLAPIDNIILPDGCIDLIIDFSKKQIFFSAYSKATEQLSLRGNINFMGVRLKPGAFHHIYNIKSSLVMDASLLYQEIEKEYHLERIFTLSKEREKIDFLFDYFIHKIGKYTPNHFEHFIETLYSNLNDNSIEKIAKEYSYSARHLNRIFYLHYGVNPKTLLNILRLHRSLIILFSDHSTTLTALAMNSGFSDQSHFIKDIKKYCGISPTELIDKYKH